MTTIYAGIGATEATAVAQIGSTGGGGGGVTVIPNGGTLSGTYEGDVFCEGDVSMAGAVTVEGKLTVIGTFTNNGGFELTVRADLFAKGMSFDRTVTSLPQSNITVDGDFQFHYLDFAQSGGSAALIRVGGDLIGSVGFVGSYIDAAGLDDTSGASIIVYGDLNCFTIDLFGGGSLAGNAGNGGGITVYGDARIYGNLNLNGGNAASTGFSAGDGGLLDVYGDAVLEDVRIYGGSSVGGSGGLGGNVDIHGSLYVLEFEGYGGDCDSTVETHFAGSGANVTVNGNLVGRDFFNVSGGNRSGALTAPGSVAPANGGNVSVRGNFTLDADFAGHGGDISVTGFTLGAAGNGSQVSITGSCTFTDDFRCNGGYNDIGNGGQGGDFTIDGELSIDDELELMGGNAIGGSAGAGGNVYARSNVRVGDVFLDGGYGTNGSGGNSGEMDVQGNLTVVDGINLRGGDCNSPNETHAAGSGGNVFMSVGNLVVDGSVRLHGGGRLGATTSPAMNSAPNSGSLYVNCGNVCVDGTLDLYGGSVISDYPNSVGGNGGNVNVVSGNLVCDAINISGGSAVGLNGGNAGNINVQGSLRADTLNANGGNANNSVVGGDAATNGSASSTLQAAAGATVINLSMIDGAGPGAAPTATVQLLLGGFSTIGTLSMVDRADAQIMAYPLFLSTLKIGSMPLKGTLNNADNTPTASIAASVAENLYTSGGGLWHEVSGTVI